jgi:hypothetical protein
MTPKKTSEADKAGGTIGELIKQKLGDKLSAVNKEDEKKEDETKEDEE